MKYVDTDVFLHWATDHPQHGRRATQILRHIELNEKAVTSSLSLWLFDRVMRDGEGYSLRAFLDQIEKIRNLKVIELRPEDLHAAAEVRAKQNLPLECALAYVVAKDRGANAIYSTNGAYDRTDLRREF